MLPPPQPVPQYEILPDVANDEDDVVYWSGLRAAEAIRRETADHGREPRMRPNAKEPKNGSAEEQHEQDNFGKVALVYDGYNLPYDGPETPQGTSQRRLRERGVNTEHANYDYDDYDYDTHDPEEEREDKEEKATLRKPQLRVRGRKAKSLQRQLGRRRSVREDLVFRVSTGLDRDPLVEKNRVTVGRSESLVFCSSDFAAVSASRARLAPLGSRHATDTLVRSSVL